MKYYRSREKQVTVFVTVFDFTDFPRGSSRLLLGLFAKARQLLFVLRRLDLVDGVRNHVRNGVLILFGSRKRGHHSFFMSDVPFSLL